MTSFLADECPFLAGGVAYQLFFALIPLLALVVGILGFVFGSQRAERELAALIRDIYPSATAEEVHIARDLVNGRAISLGVGVVGTLLGATAVHGSLDTALAAILRTGRKRSFIRGHVEALAFVLGLALIAVLSFALSYGALAAQGALAAAGLGLTRRAVIGFVSPLLGLGAGYVLFAVIYRYVPRTRYPLGAVRAAALVSAVLWEVAKVAFGAFTRGLGVFSAYGPIAFAAGLLTWVYLTAVIILMGAEIMKVRART